MRLLLDTPIAILAALDPEALTKTELRRLAGADRSLVLSAVSVCELRQTWPSFAIDGVPKGPLNPGAILAFAEAIGWEFLPLTARHAAAVLRSPMAHSDPFDELLLVQAQE